MTGARAEGRRGWEEEETSRGIVFFVFLVSFVPAGLGSFYVATMAVLGGLVGFVLATGLFYLWRERTRPKGSVGWVLLVALWAILLFAVSHGNIFWTQFLVGMLLMLPVVLMSRHDSTLSASFVLLAGLWGCFFVSSWAVDAFAQGARNPSDAVWLAVCALVVIAASTLEHERLARARGTGTPLSWTGIRLAFVGLWTFFILAVREEVQWGRLFVALGVDLSGQQGQLFLLGVIVAGVALAGWALRPAKRKN